MATQTKQRPLRLLSILCGLTALSMFSLFWAAPVQANPLSDLVGRVRDYFDPPRPDSRPPGNRIAGGAARGCLIQRPVLPIVALVPKGSREALTLSDQPIFWFYSPYSQAIVAEGRDLYISLTLTDITDANEIYRGSFSIPEEPSISHVSAPVSLAAGEEYRWYVEVVCQVEGNDSSAVLGSVDSTVRRILPDEDLTECLAAGEANGGEAAKVSAVECYARADLWYDMVTGIAELSCSEDSLDWTPLLTQGDVEVDDALEDLEDEDRLQTETGETITAEEALMAIAQAPLASYCSRDEASL
ncbi:MAG: DUF928 domain-containing protein [Elainellaceae cyanobacterium]